MSESPSLPSRPPHKEKAGHSGTANGIKKQHTAPKPHAVSKVPHTPPGDQDVPEGVTFPVSKTAIPLSVAAKEANRSPS